MSGKIYALKIKNCSDIRYIGQTKCTLEARFRGHLSEFKKYKKLNKKLNYKNTWIAKNLGNIEIVLIEECQLEELDDREIFWISYYSGPLLTNAELGGKKASPSNKGQKHTEEAKKKISEAGKGRVVSQETRNKVSRGNKGKKMSNEAKRRMSESKRGKPLPHKNKVVYEYDENDTFIRKWNSGREICSAYNILPSSISNNLKKLSKYCLKNGKKYVFKYEKS